MVIPKLPKLEPWVRFPSPAPLLASAAFDIRMMFQGYLERGFVTEDDDAATLTKLLGHEPRAYEDFAHETIGEWRKVADSRAAA
jgi:hypothetical protein